MVMASNKKQPKKKTNLRLAKRIRQSTQARLTVAFVILGFILGSFYAYHGIDNYYHSFRTYVAYQDNFKIHFPGKPTVTNLSPTKDLPGESIETSRAYYYSSSDKDYLVEAVSCLSLNGSNRSLLDGAINQASKTDNDLVSGTKFITFKGLSAAEATLLNNHNTSYLITFIYKHTFYTIQTKGLTKPEFNSFISTFHLLKR